MGPKLGGGRVCLLEDRRLGSHTESLRNLKGVKMVFTWKKIKKDDKSTLPPLSTILLTYSKKWGVCVDYASTADKFSKGNATHWALMPKGPTR